MSSIKAYIALATVLFFVGWTGYIYHAGKRAGLDQAELDARRAVAQAVKTMRAISEAYEAKEERIRVVYRTIRQEVVRYAETHSAVTCFDTEGVEIINRAAKGDAQ